MKRKIEIRNLGIFGEGVASLDGKVVFVEGALPQESVEATITEEKPKFSRATLDTIVTPSPDRIAPPCPVFGECGGCQIQHLAYPRQLEAKRQLVADALQRIGHLSCEVAPCRPSPETFAYRRKLVFSLTGEIGALKAALYAHNSHRHVPIDGCPIHASAGEQLIKEFLEALNKEKIDPQPLGRVTVKSSDSQAILTTEGPLPEPLQTRFRKSSLTEEILGLTFRISAPSFFQVNPPQAVALYARAFELCNLKGKEVLDAYCGVGALTLCAARHAKEVIGIEGNPSAIEDAEYNAKANHLSNASFLCDSVEHALPNLPSFDVALLNPPRTGCHPDVLEELARRKPEEIVYISCAPATLARDLRRLTNHGYKVEVVEPFDMFPQTMHVETLVTLRRDPDHNEQ